MPISSTHLIAYKHKRTKLCSIATTTWMVDDILRTNIFCSFCVKFIDERNHSRHKLLRMFATQKTYSLHVTSLDNVFQCRMSFILKATVGYSAIFVLDARKNKREGGLGLTFICHQSKIPPNAMCVQIMYRTVNTTIRYICVQPR